MRFALIAHDNRHDVDISMLMRLCDVHDIPLATNYKTASILIKWFKQE
jgi:methylglyoxal synthase